MHGARIAMVFALLLCCGIATAELADSNGWHTWQVVVESGELVHFHVLVEEDTPARIHSMNWGCYRPARAEAIDHGVVTATESYDWFLRVVEDEDVDRDVRDAALFGLVESASDEALDYIDGILSRR